jgi:hypothetical protein
MGVDYYVADSAKKTFYELGKGGWYALNDDKEAFQDVDYLAHYILTECYEVGRDDYYTIEENLEIQAYVRQRVAPDLFKAFGDSKKENLHIFNDCGDDLVVCRAKGYRCVGTRFGKTAEEQEDHLDHQNRHLIDSPTTKRLYNPEHFKQYREWEIY